MQSDVLQPYGMLVISAVISSGYAYAIWQFVYILLVFL